MSGAGGAAGSGIDAGALGPDLQPPEGHLAASWDAALGGAGLGAEAVGSSHLRAEVTGTGAASPGAAAAPGTATSPAGGPPAQRLPSEVDPGAAGLGARLAGSTAAARAPVGAAPVTAGFADEGIGSQAASVGVGVAWPGGLSSGLTAMLARAGYAAMTAPATAATAAGAATLPAAAGNKGAVSFAAAAELSPAGLAQALFGDAAAGRDTRGSTPGGNPLLGWAISTVLGGPEGVPLWQALGLAPAGLLDRLATAPWEVAGARLGRPVTPATFAALGAMAGPMAALLARGVHPEVALALQIGWESAMQGGRDPLTGGVDLPPLHGGWGLPDRATLSALLDSLLGREAPALPADAARPSDVMRRLLRVEPASPEQAGIAQAAERDGLDATLLLGYGQAGSPEERASDPPPQAAVPLAGPASAFAGVGLAGLRPVSTPPRGAGALALLARPGQPALLLARAGSGGLPGVGAGIALGAISLHTGRSAGLPWAAAQQTGEVATGSGAATPGLAMHHVEALLQAALAHAPVPVEAASVSVPFGLSAGAQGWGALALADGRFVRHGAATEAPLLKDAEPGRAASGPLSSLRRSGRRGTSAGGEAMMVHDGRRRLLVDVAPAGQGVATWRLDDTRALVPAAGPGGAGQAALRAADLYARLADGDGLEALGPGEGFDTWEGSPLWLSLAGIAKPLRLGVLPSETRPARVEVRRLATGEWTVAHEGAAWAAGRLLRHPAEALDTEALLRDVLYGLVADPDTAEPVACALLQRFHAAQTHRLHATLFPEPAGWRAQEAWALVARHLARLLRQVADGAAGSVAAAQRLLGQQGLRNGAGAWPELAEMAVLLAVVDGPAQAAACATPGRLALADAAANGVARVAGMLRGYGQDVLAGVLRGEAAHMGAAEAVALAACLGRLPRRGERPA